MSIAPILIQVQAVATLLMVGIIWYVQVVHYPLMALAEGKRFSGYEAGHTRRTTFVVAPPMIVEALAAIGLVWRPPPAIPAPVLWLGLALLAVIWASTAWLQVPCHRRLARGFDAGVHRRLVARNWLRTGAWTLRGAVAIYLLAAA
jgi:hypothetical protein